MMESRCSLSRPSVASTAKPRLFAERSKPERLLKKFSPYALHLASANTTLGAPSTYQLPVAVRSKSSSTKRLRLLGLMRALPNLATIFLIPLAITVVTNMNRGIGVLTMPNPSFERD